MGRPENGIYIIQGEVNLVVIAMRRNSRWTSHSHQEDEQDPLLNSFSQLKDILNTISALDELAPNEFLSPFLEVIRSEDTTGPITGLALTSINKFLSYGLIDANSSTAGAAIENIADAVTHARFVGTDPSNDEVVLMKILHVLRTLLLTPAGAMLTNESVCEIMQSCFRICFEMRLSELLRKSAEHTLMDMVQLLFSRLPQFKEDPKWATSLKKLKMRAGGMEPSRGGRFRKRSPKPKGRKSLHSKSQSQASTVLNNSRGQSPSGADDQQANKNQEQIGEQDPTASKDDGTQQSTDGIPPGSVPESLPTPPESTVASPDEDDIVMGETIATTPTAANRTVVDIQQGFKDASDSDGREQTDGEVPAGATTTAAHTVSLDSLRDATDANTDSNQYLNVPKDDDMQRADSEQDLRVDVSLPLDAADESLSTEPSEGTGSAQEAEYVNPRGVRFMPPHQGHGRDGSAPLIPYGLPCVRELFRFLVSLTNPMDRHNTDVMVHMGLSLLTVALEAGADHISSFSSLLCLVRDDLTRNLFFLLQSERLSLFAASIRVCFLLFESMRSHLKFQLEMYLTRLMDIIVSERMSYEQCEVALESIVQLLRIPGLVTELYLNYDCDLYCTNLFEDLMKLLSKNAFPVSGLFTTHLLSLDALLAVIDSIEQHCHHRVLHATKKHDVIARSQENVSSDVKIEVKDECDVTVPPTPPPSGYSVADKMAATLDQGSEPGKSSSKEVRTGPRIRPNRMKVSMNIPSEEELAAIKHKKKLYHTGSEQFNMKPGKGVGFLQEHGLLTEPLDPGQIVVFLKENPKLDKKQIGEYISSRKNPKVLEAFQKSFNFDETRIDEALRMYLETFRLPGEAPVIAYLLEHFAEHWHKMNGEPFANTDAAFTLAYAVLMLNTDQHNTNAKKQNNPMNQEDFKKNLRKVNGGQDFDEDMLEEIFVAIKNDEIVMPAEQQGLVKENFLWKMLLRRGSTKEGIFTHAPTGAFDRDLFALVWGPTVAALSFVFDKSLDNTIIQKAISGFRKCAMISAHYGISDVFDNLVISLCKFTTLLSSAESAEAIPVSFGSNNKAQVSARTMFGLAHRHGDILREGWKNILDCMQQLYRAKLLPEALITVEDFLDPSGKISLIREETAVTQRADSGVLSSFYSYFTLTDPTPQRGPSPEEQECSRQAARVISDCHVDQLVQESKFLRVDSLHELIKALIFQSQYLDHDSLNGMSRCDDDSPVFFLELLIKVILQNRDRIGPFWQSIRSHLYNLIVNATDRTMLVERSVVGLLRLANRLLCREEIAPQVLESMRILLMMKREVIHDTCRQVAFGLHDLLKTNAANIHSAADWYTLFTLLEVVGAGTNPPPLHRVDSTLALSTQSSTTPALREDETEDTQTEGETPDAMVESITESGAQSDSELPTTVSSTQGDEAVVAGRGYTSDSELYETPAGRHKASGTRAAQPNGDLDLRPLPDKEGSWVLQNDQVDPKTDNATLKVYNKQNKTNKPGENQETPNESSDTNAQSAPRSGHLKKNQFSIDLNEELTSHDPRSLTKCCETLAFLVRDAAHITPHNFESCVHTIRTFVEANLNGGLQAKPKLTPPTKEKKKSKRHKKGDAHMSRSKSSPTRLSHIHDSDEEKESDGYQTLSIQLLDLMHTLHTRAATIFGSWAEEEQNSSGRPGGEDGALGSGQVPRGEQPEGEGGEGSATTTVVVDAGTSTLWTKCWCPLLQGIACLCCDSRRQVRSQALTYLQRALLVHDLQTLSAYEWESCFNKVLFPLLSKLLENINPQDPGGLEETRMRASTLLCKVFLQHLTPLLSLSTFTALWLTILEFMDKYMHADRSDLLCEAIPESLKNMLLVMHTAGILSSPAPEEGSSSTLWRLTWDRIDTFLPNLRTEVFKPHELSSAGSGAQSAPRQTASSPVPPASTQPVITSPPQSASVNNTGAGPSEGPGSSPSPGAAPGSTDKHAQAEQQHQFIQQYSGGSVSATQQYAYYQAQYAAQAYQYSQQQHAASATHQHTQAVPVHGSNSSDNLESEARGSESYLTSTGAPQYVLHPPLPSAGSTSPAQSVPGAAHTAQPAPGAAHTVPLLLNPDLIQNTTIPIISPQSTPERNHSAGPSEPQP